MAPRRAQALGRVEAAVARVSQVFGGGVVHLDQDQIEGRLRRLRGTRDPSRLKGLPRRVSEPEPADQDLKLASRVHLEGDARERALGDRDGGRGPCVSIPLRGSQRRKATFVGVLRGCCASAAASSANQHLSEAPAVTITAPPDGSSVAQGAAVTLTDTATDAEDGDLSGNLTWTSSNDGVLGTGASITLSSHRQAHHHGVGERRCGRRWLGPDPVEDREGPLSRSLASLEIVARLRKWWS
ncbi:MAG: Ig-like domain-containing protein [Myxococcota bacterium]